MPNVGSLNLRDPRSSDINPYVSQRVQTPPVRPQPQNIIEMDERPRHVLQRPHSQQGGLSLEREVTSPETRQDFSNRLNHLSEDQLEANGRQCCPQVTRFLKSTGSHLLLGQGTLTGEVYGGVGLGSAYAANTLGGISDISGGGSDPTLQGAGVVSATFGTQALNTGSYDTSTVFAQGKLGSLLGGIGGSLASTVGLIASCKKGLEGVSEVRLARALTQQAGQLQQEAEQLRSQITSVDPSAPPPHSEVHGEMVEVDLEAEPMAPDKMHELVRGLIADTRALLGSDIFSGDSRQHLEAHLARLEALDRGFSDDFADWGPPVDRTHQLPHRDEDSDQHSVEPFDEIHLDLESEPFGNEAPHPLAQARQVLGEEVRWQAEFRDQLALLLPEVAGIKRGDGVGNLAEGVMGFTASLNGLINGGMTLASLGVPTSGTSVVTTLTEHGNRLASGLIFTQGLGAIGTTVISGYGMVKDGMERSSAEQKISKATTFLDARFHPPPPEEIDLEAQQVQPHRPTPIDQVAKLVHDENVESSFFHGMSALKNGLMTFSGLSLLTGVGLGVTTVGAVATPIGWATGLMGLTVGAGTGLYKWWSKGSQVKAIDQLEGQYRGQLNQLKDLSRTGLQQHHAALELEQHIDGLQREIHGQRAQLAELNEHLQMVSEREHHLSTQIDRGETELHQTDQALREHIALREELGERVGKFTRQLELNEQRQIELGQLDETLREEIDGLGQERHSAGEQLEGLRQQLTEVQHELEQVSKETPKEAEQAKSQPNPAEALRQRASELEQKISSQQEKLSGLDSARVEKRQQRQKLGKELRLLAQSKIALERDRHQTRQAFEKADRQVGQLSETYKQQAHALQELKLEREPIRKNLNRLDGLGRDLLAAIGENQDQLQDLGEQREGLEREIGQNERDQIQTRDQLKDVTARLRMTSPKAAVETLIEALHLDSHDPLRQEAEAFLGEVLDFKPEEITNLGRAERHHAAEVLIAKMGIAYLG